MFSRQPRSGFVLGDGRETLRESYVMRQLDTIYAMAFLTHWVAESLVAPGAELNAALGTDLIVHLNRIVVVKKHRGRNYGHELLRTICRDADRFKTVMTLDCDPDDQKNYAWIHGMYEHAGFQDHPEIGGMVRWPRG